MTTNSAAAHAPTTNRWGMLFIGVLCMILIANYQYGWTLFVRPMAQAHGWTIAGIQLAFSVFIALETWGTPVTGWISDYLGPQLGPKIVVAAGGLLVAIGWIINSYADTLTMLYVGAVLSGIGAGGVYSVCVGNAVKWFPDRRGLAVGLTAAGFGAGAALTVIPVRMVIESHGYQSAFFWFGLVQGAIIFVVAWFLRAPLPNEMPGAGGAPVRVAQTSTSFTPGRDFMHQRIDRHHNDTFHHSRKGRLAAMFLGCIVSISAVVNFISAFRSRQVLYGGRIAPTGWISYHAHPVLFTWVLAIEACATIVCIGVIYAVFFKDIDQA